MHAIKQSVAGGFLALFLANGLGQEARGFLCQTIELPTNGMARRFVDLNNNGRMDLLATDPTGNQLFIYRQHAWGFTNAPDQILELPPQTAWITAYHVETNKGFELLMSTAAGLAYYRQNDGIFEPKPRTLVEARQVFTNMMGPGLFATFTNGSIPVIMTNGAVLWRTNGAGKWIADPFVPFNTNHCNWSTTDNGWTMGASSSRSLSIYHSFYSTTNFLTDDKPKNDGVTNLLAELNKKYPGAETQEVDLDGDGQKDLIIWQTLGKFDFKTDVYVFLRGSDGKLPEQPTQVLHCRGFPIPDNTRWNAKPAVDLRGDGKYELVLLEPKVIAASIGGLVDTLLSHGVDIALTIRTFNHGSFSHSADESVPMTVVFSVYGTGNWPFFIAGDFNGDGRPDILVQRSVNQWDIYLSTTNGHWFNTKPGMTFELPSGGYFDRFYFDIEDLNGDGRADIVLHDPDSPRILVFLTQPSHTKGSP